MNMLMLTDGLIISKKREYIPNRMYEYMKQLKAWDTVFVCVDDLCGEEEGIVVSNDGTRVVLQLQWKERVVQIIDFTPIAITVLSSTPIPEDRDNIPF